MRVEGSYSVYPVRAIIVMGVGGCGKTTIGTRLAQLLGNAPFIDADSLHPAENVAKMSKGLPLTDSDRWPWLQRVREEIEKEANRLITGQNLSLSATRKIIGERMDGKPSSQCLYVVCACSSLKRSYRELLSRSDPDTPVDVQTHDTVFLYIDVGKQELARRLTRRTGHFFSVSLLDSQLETLEPPDTTREAAIVVHGDDPEDAVVDEAHRKVTHYVTKNSL
ncbi:hypothetical protein IW140_003404 [Coemansia sp. RSA 1813]|nr:hypothetical protein EV178_003221 [Coemansia sp. RSA 1646]KAJ1771029.1 hypothetical protein LPJ74_002720 [Coemansia sp. RSA 1843]KAJ2089268.1 hypothetical protein IW138_003588 [Coemansia sp. RSA 986]KAJ2215097.1 hypothetical protein EV179_002465 [Coemansia sp. RSA 487]KAJ2569039.1 hypothetical protein IW140_003404 [Coemansia sp. RSA 1813]